MLSFLFSLFLFHSVCGMVGPMFGAAGLPSSIILSEAPSQTRPMACPLERILNPAKVMMTQVNCPQVKSCF